MKKYFVILQQDELEKCKTPAQIAVFASIKSYSSNGKQKIGLSLRDISQRAGCSHEHVRQVSTELTELGLIKIVGTETRRGGAINIYEVSTTKTVNAKVSSELTVKNSKVSTAGVLSVNSTGAKLLQSNKVNIEENIISHYLQNANSKEKITPLRKKKIIARLKTFTQEEIKQAITNCFTDKFYSGDNDSGWKANFDYIFKNDENLDKLLNLIPKKRSGLSDEEIEKRII